MRTVILSGSWRSSLDLSSLYRFQKAGAQNINGDKKLTQSHSWSKQLLYEKILKETTRRSRILDMTLSPWLHWHMLLTAEEALTCVSTKLQVHQSLDFRQKDQGNLKPGLNFWSLPLHLTPLFTSRCRHACAFISEFQTSCFSSLHFCKTWVLGRVED